MKKHKLPLLLALLSVAPVLPAQQPAAPPAAGPEVIHILRDALARMEYISLPSDAARRAMRQFPKEDDLYAWLSAELEKEKSEVRLEKLALLKVRMGQRSKLEETGEIPYPTEFDPNQIPQTIALGMNPPPAASTQAPVPQPSPAPLKPAPLKPAPPKPAPSSAPTPPPAPAPGAKGDTGAPGVPGAGTVLAAPGSVPTRLFPPWPYSTCSATAHSFRNTGLTAEIEMWVQDDGKTINVTMAPEICRFKGMISHVTSGEEVQPIFDTSRLSTRLRTKLGHHSLAGTVNPSANTGTPNENTESRTWLMFLTPMGKEEVLTIKPGDNSGDPFAVDPDAPPADTTIRQALLRFDLISLPSPAARRALIQHPVEPGLYDWLDGELAKKNPEVSLHHTCALRVRAGQRGKLESIAEYPYGTEMDPPQIPQTFTAGPGVSLPTLPAGEGRVFPPWPYTCMTLSAFTFRNLGLTLEAEATIGEDGKTVDLNLAAETARLTALMPQGVLGEVLMPVFETSKITCQVLALSGQPVLVSTLSPPTGTGAPGGNKADRVWFLFVTATVTD